MLNILQNSGISRVDQYVRNKEGELQSAAPDGLRYIVKEWFSEDECDIRDENEVVKAAGQIAKLHRILRGIQLKEEWNLGSILAEPMEAEFRRHNRELRKARAFISRKRGKSDFELCVIGNFAPFLEQALEAQRGLEQMAEEGRTASLSLPRRAEPAPYFNGGKGSGHYRVQPDAPGRPGGGSVPFYQKGDGEAQLESYSGHAASGGLRPGASYGGKGERISLLSVPVS